MATSWNIGDRIQNRWEIYSIISGGMGVVYIVYDHSHRNVYAAKTFRDEIFAQNELVADRFRQEALTWLNIDVHQNVAQALFVDRIEGKPYIFLEFVGGGNLRRWVGTPRLSEDLAQALRFAIQFCDGMSFALSKGIAAHRDVKPENCLIALDGMLKVSDFGLARATEHEGIEAGGGGTPEYMAPEQWDSFDQVDLRTDIYSFGVMFYEMLTGKVPYGYRPAVGIRELERRHKRQHPSLLEIRHLGIQKIVGRCLAKDPADRFTSFQELRKPLTEVYEDLTGTAPPEPATGAALDAARLNNKAGSLGILGFHHEALSLYHQALVLNPRMHEAWSGKGTELNALGRVHEAIIHHDRSLELNPEYADGWLNRGSALGKLGQYTQEVACYDRALEINPRHAKAWNNKGVALGDLGRHEAALECYRRAIELIPTFEDAWLNRGVSLGALGRGAEEMACYDRVIEINPDYELAWHNKGRSLGEELGRWEEAISCYGKAVALKPTYTKAWYNRGVALVMVKRYQEALASFRRATELDSQHVDAWFNQGETLRLLTRPHEAIVCFERVLELNPDHMHAWYLKGLVMINSFGKYAEALECFQQADRLGYPQAADAIAVCRRNVGS